MEGLEPPIPSALYKTSPGPNSVAVCADQFALGDLRKDPPLALGVHQEFGDVSNLVVPREMIPLHRGGVEDATTVGAWFVSLEILIPHPQAGHSLALLEEDRLAVARVGSLVHLPLAALADALMTFATTVELRQGLWRVT